ncbi:MAG: hypothetical protein KIS86_14970 [Devosia sp.]|nr:hypothetical protein [Devosia sp.]
MAVVTRLYNSAARRLINQSVDLDNLKVMLLSNSAAFNAAHTTLEGPAGVANANEVDGNGWTTGGELIENVAVSTITTDDAMIDGDDIVVTAVGGPIGDAFAAVIYDDSDPNDAPLAFISFGQAVNAGESTDFKFIWPSDGIFKFTYTPPA